MIDVVVPCQYDLGNGELCEQDVPMAVDVESEEAPSWDSPGAPAIWSVVSDQTCPQGHRLTPTQYAETERRAIHAAHEEVAARELDRMYGGPSCP